VAVGDELMAHHDTARAIGVPGGPARSARSTWSENVGARS